MFQISPGTAHDPAQDRPGPPAAGEEGGAVSDRGGAEGMEG